MTCGECSSFNYGQALKPYQHMAVCPFRLHDPRMYVRDDQSACKRFSQRFSYATTLPLPLWRLMGAQSVRSDYCVVCGRRATNQHHVVRRGAGMLSVEGVSLSKPTLSLCGSGTTGCHGKAHEGRLHFDFVDGEWLYLETDEPMNQLEALELEDGWKRIGGFDD